MVRAERLKLGEKKNGSVGPPCPTYPLPILPPARSRDYSPTISHGFQLFHRPLVKSGTSCGLPPDATDRMLNSTMLESAAAS